MNAAMWERVYASLPDAASMRGLALLLIGPPASALNLSAPVAAALAERAGPMVEYCQRAERRKIYLCVICLENPVNVYDGEDTCPRCLARQ